MQAQIVTYSHKSGDTYEGCLIIGHHSVLMAKANGDRFKTKKAARKATHTIAAKMGYDTVPWIN